MLIILAKQNFHSYSERIDIAQLIGLRETVLLRGSETVRADENSVLISSRFEDSSGVKVYEFHMTIITQNDV